ncbi:hypothetical protein H4R34_001330 [Dimargaris verticillata]|uniref:Uncharacterized protein n=1 Tax=Dimargaris verticillata TaxID=2761393 RepID=A0A9W8B5P0_9FUNG|nr:hypothetical protein H4R34_001330 [Dimargaris verticillata]
MAPSVPLVWVTAWLALCVIFAAGPAHGLNPHWRANVTLARRDDCPQGQLLCDFFGCVPGSTCPDQCNARGAGECGFSINGKGCRWQGNSCIQDIQCGLPVDGKCSVGCIPCGNYGCAPAGMTCPTPCAGIADPNQCNGASPLNGRGCRWQDNSCVLFDETTNNFATASSVSYHSTATSSDSASEETEVSASDNGESTGGEEEDSGDMAPVDSSDMGRTGAVIGGVVGGMAFLGILILAIHRIIQKKNEVRRNGVRLRDDDVSNMSAPEVRYKPEEFLPVVRDALNMNHIQHTHNRALPI